MEKVPKKPIPYFGIISVAEYPRFSAVILCGEVSVGTRDDPSAVSTVSMTTPKALTRFRIHADQVMDVYITSHLAMISAKAGLFPDGFA